MKLSLSELDVALLSYSRLVVEESIGHCQLVILDQTFYSDSILRVATRLVIRITLARS